MAAKNSGDQETGGPCPAGQLKGTEHEELERDGRFFFAVLYRVGETA